MSLTGNAIRQLKEALLETVNALDAVSKVLDDTELFYFELFRQRGRLGEALDQDYVESWERELDLQQLGKNDPYRVEAELHTVQQAMTEVINKLYPAEIIDDQ